ncbi:Amyloid-beta A4 precursor protein-binding family A member 1 [Nibea albiflora]|uniref:Amyloid-beta A4 protein-binding family A member 1 n=1 Tax=Nibea albiflora TaxID=240163 RepID=A0ACB7F9N0_NIBAL|nr:Amyloid-beta A4 precursor protein-binding family A member 1 [Nibea albiflora]
MSHKYQGEASGEAGEEHKAPPRSRQPNGTSPGEAPVRRSWRPCQMLNQDGEPNPHHHHHRHHHHHQQAPTGRGPPRHRRRPQSGHGQGQSQAQSPGQAPVVSPSRPEEGEIRETEPRPVQQPRPAVARYRRHGDPNPRLRGHRQRHPIREVQDSSPGANDRESPAELQVQQHSSGDPVMDQLQDRGSPHQTDRGSPHQTPVAVVTPTHLSPGPATHNMQLHPRHTPPAKEEEDLQERKVECEEEPKEVKEKEEEQEQAEDDGDHHSTTGRSSCSHDDMQVVDGAEERAERVEEDQEEVMDDVAEDIAAQGSEITDLCSDTESAASLSMDGPLHSPPPLQSPTPPSSPDVPPFPQLDHFSEETSLSPLPDNDLLPDDEEEEEEDEDEEDDDEDCSESCSLSRFTSSSESYPKTYADFYSESHQKSYTEPVYESYPEPKSHPNSFPEPLKTSYPELHREPRRQSGWRTEPIEAQQESRQEPFTSHRHENVQKGAPSSPTKSSHYAPRQSRDRGSHHPPLDRSVGCRLHHYDGQSDGEGDSADQSPVPKNRRQAPRQAETQAKSPSSGQSSSGEAQEERNVAGLHGEEGTRGSGDAISMAIKDIKEAIEEVKTKTVRSPYTPDKPVEPIWVMRQEVSPTEDAYPLQTTAGHSSPHSPSQSASESPSRYAPVPAREPIRRSLPQFPTFVDVPGPCDPEDLIDGIIFAATYLGCTHLLSERTPTKSARMQQAQEAMSRVRAAQKQAKNRKKSPDGEAPSTAEVDLFMSTQRIKVLNADTQESLMDLPLRTISYIADIGNMVVLMARGKMVRSRSAQENLDNTAEQTTMTHDDRRLYRMICHVFESEDSFSVAYQEFLRANGIDPEDLSQREYSDLLNTQDMYNDDLIHFSKSENCRDVYIEKQKGEILGVVIVESGWGSILPTVIIASMMHAGPAEKSGRLNIGDQIMTINGTSLVGLPLSTCQSIIKGLKSQSRIKMNIVRCPPVTMVLIRRPDLRYQLGFSVQNGIICSLMRGGIAERGGVRVGHRIIEINSQSVVATPHEKIVQILSNAMGEIHMKTMPAAMYRLLTAQEQPVYI